MKILSDNNQFSKQSHIHSHALPSKMNIKLKTHSLTSLDVPLETFVGCKTVTSSFDHDHRKAMAGSVDRISEIRQHWNEEKFSHSTTTKPLINMVSSNEQPSSVRPEWQHLLKHRFRMSTSSISPSSLNDSIARFRHKRHLANNSQSSLQTIDKISERKHRSSLFHHSSIPKFTFRDLPSNTRSSKSSPTSMSPFTSLPEIRSFVTQNCSDHLNTLNDKSQLPILSSSSASWEKSGSWSWKSNHISRLNAIKNQRGCQVDDHLRSNLPVIIESPLQQRSSLQTLNQNHYDTPLQSNPMHRSNLSFRLYQKKKSVPHSFSNYAVSSRRFSSQLTNRCPSTPILSCSQKKRIPRFTSNSTQINISPLASFDDDDTDSLTSDSSFRSCIDSVKGSSDDDTLESSSLSDSDYSETFFNLDSKVEINDLAIKHSRTPVRHLCLIQ